MATDREIALEQALIAVFSATHELGFDLVDLSQKAKTLIIDNLKYRMTGHPHTTNVWSEAEAILLKVSNA